MAMKQPNILLITSDQQHWNTLGVINSKIKTPALDRLCREGTRFNRAYCPNPTCTPTRASIITGQYPSQHGAWSLGTKLDENAPTVGDALRGAGYATTLIGKAHFQPLASAPNQTSIECQPLLRDLEFWRDFHGPWYGFDHVETARMHADEAHAGGHYAIWMEEKGLKNWRDYFQEWPQNNKPPRRHEWDLPAEFHYTTWTAERSIAAIETSVQNEQPFFLWASFHDPHPPYLVPQPWATMYDPADMELGTLEAGEHELLPPHFGETQKEKPDFSAWRETNWANHGFHSHSIDEDMARCDMAVYYGMTSFMDEQIGRILDSLDALGIADDTIIIFTTDHGHFLGQHGLFHKGAFHYEDLLRLPFIVRWPGQVPQGATSEALQSLVDLAPTFLHAANIDVPGQMTGRSQLDVWRGRAEAARDYAVCEFRHQPTKLHLRTLITSRYKITIYRNESYGELFDLECDPDERRNLWDDAAHADTKCQMLRRLVDAALDCEPTRYGRIAHA
jgi:arylsulfatase A-like enzyme